MSLEGPPTPDPEAGWTRTLDNSLVVGAWICLVAWAVYRLFAYDIWWQIGAGEWILSHGIPASDPFSYAFPGREWIEPRWLWCVLVSAVFHKLGANALILAKLGLLASAFALLGAAGRGRARWVVALGMCLALAAAHERFLVRPELLSFVALLWVLLCVERYRAGRSAWWIYSLPLIQILWSNAHTLWILGPATLWIIVASEVVEARLLRHDRRRDDGIRGPRLRKLIAVTVAASLAALANPYLFRGVLFPFRLFHEISSAHPFSETIAEFRGSFSAYFFAWDFRTVAYLLVIAVSAYGFWQARHAISLGRAAVWLAFLFLSVQAQRNVALFGFVAGFMTILNLGEPPPRQAGWSQRRVVSWSARAVVAVFLVVMIPLIVTNRFYRSQGSLKRFGVGVSDNRFPIRALAFVHEQGLPVPVIHALGDGGYVLFDGGPGSVYVDGRLEVYGSHDLERAFRVTWTGEGLDEEAARTGVRTVIVRNEIGYRPLMRRLEQSESWVPVYFDPLHLVYLRDSPETRSLVQRLELNWADPVRRHVEPSPAVAPPDWLAGLGWPATRDGYADERLGSLFAGVGNYDLALRHFEVAYGADPRNARTRMLLGLFREALGREASAMELLDGVPRSFLADPSVHVLAARIDLWASNAPAAVEHLRLAVGLGAPEPETSLSLSRAALLAEDVDQASAVLERLAQSHPGVPEVWNLNAVASIKRGDLPAAAEHFESSVRLDPDQPEVYRELGRIYTELGQPDRAKEANDRANR